MKVRSRFSSQLAFILLCGFLGTAAAQGEMPEPKSDEWQFTVAPLYLWAVGIDGTIGVGPAAAPVNSVIPL